MISLRYSTIGEKRKVYEWLCLSDTTPTFMGDPYFPDHPIPTWEEYLDDFEDFYFIEDEKEKGSVMIIENDGEEVGCVCHSSFHLKQECAELDIWMKSEACCGKGFGTTALKMLIEHLQVELRKTKFIIRPAERNIRAVKAYEKAGFRRVVNKEATHKEYYLSDDYLNKYGEGDYGSESTATMTIEI
ncbi:GNAT family N-acetyltransferase [Prevotella sp. 10(H)]|uniref:GNAT family N-acetyltransferase n=1 Tax=Prevotella sp. 10(H) TaxID=1158294 RepID=UPI0004A77C3E|nr:GNAT family N-acetyltransferase [Prevotella sp. 10(H)]